MVRGGPAPHASRTSPRACVWRPFEGRPGSCPWATRTCGRAPSRSSLVASPRASHSVTPSTALRMSKSPPRSTPSPRPSRYAPPGSRRHRGLRGTRLRVHASTVRHGQRRGPRRSRLAEQPRWAPSTPRSPGGGSTVVTPVRVDRCPTSSAGPCSPGLRPPRRSGGRDQPPHLSLEHAPVGSHRWSGGYSREADALRTAARGCSRLTRQLSAGSAHRRGRWKASAPALETFEWSSGTSSRSTRLP